MTLLCVGSVLVCCCCEHVNLEDKQNNPFKVSWVTDQLNIQEQKFTKWFQQGALVCCIHQICPPTFFVISLENLELDFTFKVLHSCFPNSVKRKYCALLSCNPKVCQFEMPNCIDHTDVVRRIWALSRVPGQGLRKIFEH